MKPKIYHNAFIIINRKTSKSIIVWISLLVVLLISIIMIGFFYKYNNTKQTTGYVKKIDNDYKVIVYIEKEDIEKFSNYKMRLDEQLLNFEIFSISEEYYLIDSKQHYLLYINLPLNEEQKIENNILNLVLEKEQTTLYNQLKKGWEKWKN